MPDPKYARNKLYSYANRLDLCGCPEIQSACKTTKLSGRTVSPIPRLFENPACILNFFHTFR